MAEISKFLPPNAGGNSAHNARLGPRAAMAVDADEKRDPGRGTPAAGRVAGPREYIEQEQVSFRARVMMEAESPENLRSLSRLKKIFESGQPLRGDVPRGFYLNLRV